VRIFLFVLCVLSFLAGFITLADAKSAIQEIPAFLLFVMGAVLLVGATIIDAIESQPKVKPSDAATYDHARRLANVALWTIDIQRRWLNSTEPEDKDFPFRQWSDFPVPDSSQD
jgi:hypothetical protein